MLWSVLKRGWTWKELQEVCFFFFFNPGLKVKNVFWETKRCHMCHMTLDQTLNRESNRKVRANQQVCIGWVLTHALVIRWRQSRNIWLSSRRLARQMMKKSKVRPESWQHRASSFFHHEQTLPKLEDQNSRVYLAPNGSGDVSFISPTSDRVTNGSYWRLTLCKRQT